MDDNTLELVTYNIRSENTKRIKKRASQLKALGIKTSPSELVKTALQDSYVSRVKRQAVEDAVVMIRTEFSSTVPDFVSDDDLVINAVLDLYFEELGVVVNLKPLANVSVSLGRTLSGMC